MVNRGRCVVLGRLVQVALAVQPKGMLATFAHLFLDLFDLVHLFLHAGSVVLIAAACHELELVATVTLAQVPAHPLDLDVRASVARAHTISVQSATAVNMALNMNNGLKVHAQTSQIRVLALGRVLVKHFAALDLRAQPAAKARANARANKLVRPDTHRHPALLRHGLANHLVVASLPCANLRLAHVAMASVILVAVQVPVLMMHDTLLTPQTALAMMVLLESNQQLHARLNTGVIFVAALLSHAVNLGPTVIKVLFKRQMAPLNLGNATVGTRAVLQVVHSGSHVRDLCKDASRAVRVFVLASRGALVQLKQLGSQVQSLARAA